MLKLGVSTTNTIANLYAGLWSNGWIDIFAGTPVVNADDPNPSTPLVSIPLPLSAFLAASNGTIQLNGTWFSTVTVAGTASWFRLRDANSTNTLIGDITGTGGGGKMTLSATALVVGAVMQITAFTLPVSVGS